uniref:Uncharacterized protein n=1 Tax=Corvus moneduloides TaxID=1196302 RepID=A0A8U7NXS8_CORMO
MCNRSHTQVKEFILFGFLSSQHLQVFLFVFFRSVYVLTVMGNLCIIVFVSTHHPRHHPMYYFPCNFAFLEIWFTTACIPKTLANLMYFVFSFGCTEYFFLAAMAYDHYLAVCYPLSYSTIMTSTLSRGLAVGSLGGWFPGHFSASAFDFQVVFLWIPSAQGWQRSFSTFSSHLIVVIIWYCFTIFLHVKPSIKAPLELKGMRKSFTILNTAVTSLLNPFIYTFRNTEVKNILTKALSR